MDARKIGKKLRELRGTKQLTDVANAINISKSALCMYETGQRIPRDEIKQKIASYYDASISSIFFEE